MLPKYSQCRKAIWDAVNPRTGKKRIDEAFPKSLRKNTNKQEMKIEFNCGSTWQLAGSDAYDQLVGSSPVGIVFSEYAIANPMAWGYLRPILLENNGWALFIYTSRGDNHGKTLYNMASLEDDWFCEMVKADESPVFTPEQLRAEKAEYEATYGPELGGALFDQEYMCSFEGAQLGAFYAKQITIAHKENRICNVPHDPTHEVYTFWDLGVDDANTIWFGQFIGKEVRWIDYYENSGEGLAHYAKVLRDKPYTYGDLYLPHDGASRKLSETAETAEEILNRLGFNSIIVVTRAKDTMAVLRGIEAVRNKFPFMWFDKEKCKQGIMCLTNYKAEYDNEKKKLGNRPLHDWSSHGADAMRTYGVGYEEKIQVKSAYDFY